MCGIAGTYWYGSEPIAMRPAVDRMVEALRHRGPDSSGWIRSRVGEVGFRRLSIIDLATGDQPLANEDGSVECFLNGEIFNYLELREELVERGHRLRTMSDTEVLPHLYEELGEAMFLRLRGMFVVCVVDHGNGTMLVARDHFGVKQLYYARVPRGVVFASELKGVLASGVVRAEVDDASLVPYLSLLYTPHPHTLVKGVAKLAPGALLRFTPDSEVEERTYYTLPTDPAHDDIETEDAARHVADLLGESVRLQLQADVPVGVSLSGGTDSSAIASLATLSRSGADNLTAITISWPDTAPHEVAHSRELCAQLGIRQEILEPEVGAMEDELPLLAWISDEPVADPATYSQFRVAVAAGRHVKVLLGGAGGDELFGGYGHYMLPWKKGAYASLPSGVQRSVQRLTVPRWMDNETAAALVGYRSSRFLWHRRAVTHLGATEEALLGNGLGPRTSSTNLARLFDEHGARDHVNQQLLVDLQSYLPEQLLTMLDRATMAASIEGRVPFVDVPLVEFCVSLSGRTKLGFPQARKRLLKQAIAERVPARILRGAKSGMPSHFPTLIARRPELVRQLVLGPDAYAREVLPGDWLRQRVSSVAEMQRSFPVLYALVVFEVWRRLFVIEKVYDRPTMSLSELFRLPSRALSS